MKITVLKLFAILFLGLATATKNEPADVSSDKPDNNYVIKLAIFYDANFSKRFDNNSKRIQKYWEATIFELHYRFQTFTRFPSSFLVTSLNITQEPENKAIFQGFESHKNDPETAVKCLRKDFQSWTYSQLNKIPSFDIAVLAVGAPNSELIFADKSTMDSICNAQNDIEKKWMASLVISIEDSTAPAEMLPMQIAHIMGATLRSGRASCLEKIPTEVKPIINSAKLFKDPSELYGFSPSEQCKIFLNEKIENLLTEFEPASQCKQVTCVQTISNRKTTFRPLDGSVCGKFNQGRCFGGLCIAHALQLVNVATGKCLVSEKGQFAVNDKLVLQECSRVVTQALLAPATKYCYDREELVLAIPYWNRFRHTWKVLGKNLNMELVFCAEREECRDTLVVLHRLNDADGQEFLLEKDDIRIYLKAAEDGVNLKVTRDGSGNDKASRWKFVEFAKGATVPHKCGGKSNIKQVYKEPVLEMNRRIEL